MTSLLKLSMGQMNCVISTKVQGVQSTPLMRPGLQTLTYAFFTPVIRQPSISPSNPDCLLDFFIWMHKF